MPYRELYPVGSLSLEVWWMKARSLGLVSLVLALAVDAAPAGSQTSGALLSWLRDAPDARTRAQAALTVGRTRPEGARRALETALGDPSGAVRAAAAVGLASLGDGAAVAALERHTRDPDVSVRAEVTRALAALQGARVDWARVRYVVGPGLLTSTVQGGERHLGEVHDAIADGLRGRAGLAFHEGALPAEARARVQRGRLRAYTLDGGLRGLQRTDTESGVAVRAEVSLVLVAQPANAIMGLITGAATARGGLSYGGADPGQQLESAAVRAAVRGALQNLDTSLDTLPR